MKYKAVIFDLFGTIVDFRSEATHIAHKLAIASLFGVSGDEFGRIWRQTMSDRDLGCFGSAYGDLENAATLLGLRPDREIIQQALEMRIRYYREYLEPRHGAIECLTWLKSHGYKIGLITVCASEVPIVWYDTLLAPFIDACVFSCLEGVTKPDKRIYQLACDRLSVEPGDCLYIGDGSYQELAGAQETGMHSIMIDRGMKGDCVDKHVHTDIEEWDGPRISCLTEIIGLLR